MARRSMGESTVYQDETGRWHAYVSMGLKDNGRRDRRHLSGQTRKVVVDKMKELERRRDAQTLGTPGKLTVAAWLDYWLDNIAARKVRPSTLERYRQLVTHQLKPKLGHHRLARLQPEHVERAYGELLESGRANGKGGLSPRTVGQAHAVLHRALRVAMQRDKVARNVCDLVEPPSFEDYEVQPFDIAAARAILRAADSERNGLRWYIGLALGLRQGETLGMQWEYIDLDNATLRVRWALQRQTGNGLVLVPPKSRAGNRVIGLPAPFVEALRRHKAMQDAERAVARNEWEEQGFVFCQPNGKPIDPRGDNRRWHSLLERAGVDPKRLHDARHTAATIMLALGIPARVVMEILGHSQISLTQNTYTHVLSSVAFEAADKIGALFGSPMPAIEAAS